jgi:PAS domain S-box-containing protein
MTGWSIQRKTIAAFTAVLIVLLAVVAATYFTTESFLRSSARVPRSLEAIAASERVYSSLIDLVFRQRAYVVSSNPAELSARTAARDRLVAEVALLSTVPFSTAPDQQARIATLRTAIQDVIAIADEIVAIQGIQNATPQRQVELRTSTAALMSQIRATIDELAAFERNSVESFTAGNKQAAIQLYGTIASVAAIFLAAFSWLLWRIYADVETRDAVERRLERTNSFLESLLENIPTMVFVKDARELRFVRFNQAGEQLLGYSRGDLIGKSDRDFFPPEQADFFINKDREVLVRGHVSDIPEEEIDTRQGRRILHTRKVPLFDTDGHPSLLLGISMDITEQKLVEREVRKLNDELRIKAEALTAVNQELESFCYSVSHDLRAPLRAIDGYSNILVQDHADQISADAKRLLNAISHNSRHMAELIDDLLEFSRLGRQAFTVTKVDMTELAEQAAAEIIHGLQGSKSPIVSIQPLLHVQGDPKALHHVWLNLIDNAVKYSANTDSPTVSVRAERGEGEIVYSVCDNGVGFDMRYYDKLFGVFERLHSPKEYPGTGVGLAIVKRVVTRHGGRVWAESIPGRGATFRFSLPVVEAALAETQATPA